MANGKERPRVRHDGFTPARKRKCLKALEKHGTIADACRIAGISRETFRRHRNRWPDFRAAVEAALAQSAGTVEAIAWQRATVGGEEVTIRDGQVVQVKRKPSDAMLRMLLMASNPKKFGRMGSLRRKEIEKELRAQIEAEVREEWMKRNYASNEEVRESLTKALHIYGIRVMKERAERAAQGGAERGEGEGQGPL